MSPRPSPRLNGAAGFSLFTETSEPLPEEPKPVEMPFHHCHRDPLPQPGLTPERLQAQKQLGAACAVCCVFMAGEVVGKSASGSANPTRQPLPKPLSTQSPSKVPGEVGQGEMRRVGWWQGARGCPGLRKWARVDDSTFKPRARAEGQGWLLSIS